MASCVGGRSLDRWVSTAVVFSLELANLAREREIGAGRFGLPALSAPFERLGFEHHHVIAFQPGLEPDVITRGRRPPQPRKVALPLVRREPAHHRGAGLKWPAPAGGQRL